MKKFIPKIIKPVENFDNLHCLQVSTTMALSFFNIKKSLKEVSQSTGFTSISYSWFPPTVNYLNSLGTKATLFSLCDYERLVREGLSYMEKLKGKFFEIELNRGDYKNFDFVKSEAEKMLKNKNFCFENISIKKLAIFLQEQKHLAIAKTQTGWIDGKTFLGNSHYVLCTRECKNKKWEIYDPQPPSTKKRKIPQTIKGTNNTSLFGDVVLIESQ